MTLLSTTSHQDLALDNNDLVCLSSELPGIPEEQYLAFSNRWFVGSAAACSCSFRHASAELGFGVPEDWYHEEANDITATRQVIALIRSLLEHGAKVDVVDAWIGDPTPDELSLSGDIEVNLQMVDDASFRFFENYRFSFT